MNDLLDIFQAFKRMLCICPCCGEMMRLSDLHLRYVGKAPKTWLDKYDYKLLTQQKKEELFEQEEAKIREKSIERGRKKVPKLVKKCLCPEFKQLKYDPYDIKAIMHPVDFIVFDGLNEGDDLKRIIFLSRRPIDKIQTPTLQSIRKTIAKRNYDWKVARISINGEVDFE